VKVKRLKPSQIAVFAQQDSYGDAGFSGVAKAVRALGGDENAILRLHYQRNTVDVDDASIGSARAAFRSEQSSWCRAIGLRQNSSRRRAISSRA
jgi:hypothetical protein